MEFAVFHPWKALTTLAVGIILGLSAFYAYQVSAAFGAVAVEEFNPDGAREAIATGSGDGEVGPPIAQFEEFEASSVDLEAELGEINGRLAGTLDASDFQESAFGDPIADEVFEAYLLVGSDASGYLADTIILGLQPSAGGSPIMVSLPRDLYVWNVCRETFTRINTGLGGCPGVATGPELLAIMVQDYTGVPIDHLARVNFDGFARVVDVMGGMTVCIDNPRRDIKAHLLLESTGCRLVDGETALAWVRSRHPEELVAGEWKPMAGSDFSRQRSQQDALFQLAGRAAGFSSPASLTDKLSAVASSVRLDSSWSFGQAVATAWRYRGISQEDVRRFSIDVSEYRTSTGAAVLLPTKTFGDQLGEVYDLSVSVNPPSDGAG